MRNQPQESLDAAREGASRVRDASLRSSRVCALDFHIVLFATISVFFALGARAQELPSRPDRPWLTPDQTKLATRAIANRQPKEAELEDRVYTLSDLIDFAEAHNPETREAWQAAVAQAKETNVARSALFPSLDVGFLALSQRNGVLLYDTFVIQELGIGEVSARLTYTVFDANERLNRVRQQRELLHAASFRFNDAHRKLLYSVMHGYYTLLNAQGQREAAQANYTSAAAVADSTQARFDEGLATLPDLSEAKAAAAQANYEVQLRIGDERKAAGTLATTLTAPPDSAFKVQSIADLEIPSTMADTARGLIETALHNRPDLLAQASNVDAAKAGVRAARSRYYPSVSFNGTLGELRAIGGQSDYLAAYATGKVWDAEMNLRWNVFDGGERRNRVAEGQADVRREQEALRASQDRIESEVWNAYVDAQTALRQRDAATALLNASQDSYNQALESYQAGVRNIVDVLTAQRQLAQARFEDTAARVAVLDSFAQVQLRTGTLLRLVSQMPRTAGARQP
ncbi:TolC family protein [Terriglobus aquaticus]|uniref:TolC family protein n=1 Tax=Terriglobus aquaticus TaxID=940139 RepID=A0ABW9KMF7_9BACT|nr:TolC family protein [Terriglobus aquaticus]